MVPFVYIVQTIADGRRLLTPAQFRDLAGPSCKRGKIKSLTLICHQAAAHFDDEPFGLMEFSRHNRTPVAIGTSPYFSKGEE